MRKLFFASAIASGVVLGAAMPASAMTAAPLVDTQEAPAVTLVSGGCGPWAHRTPWGACRPNGGVVYRRYGWHRHWHHW